MELEHQNAFRANSRSYAAEGVTRIHQRRNRMLLGHELVNLQGAAELVFEPFQSKGGNASPAGDGGHVATAAGVCALSCVLPFALPAVALAPFRGAIAWLNGADPLISADALLMVIAAWLWIDYRSYKLKARPATSTLVVMLIATLMLGLALLWPSLEASVIAILLG